ncbi:hypothetical protein D3C77_712340 [compost metagenome]
MDLEEEIPNNHVVRVINDAVKRISDAVFDAAYPGGTKQLPPADAYENHPLCPHLAHLLFPSN